MTTQSTAPASAAASNSTSAATTATATAEKKPVLSSDFETFLKMLTTQMKNQDPLNPVDATDYATQLATFSSVEQQVLTNDLLQQLTEKMTGSSIQQLGTWVGMEALARAPVPFDGQAVTLRPEYEAGAETASLVVRNSAGTVVETVAIDPNDAFVTWTGIDSNGVALPYDTYSFSVESYSAGTLLGSSVAPAYSRIVEARQSGDATMLTLSDGSEIEADLVIGVRSGKAGT